MRGVLPAAGGALTFRRAYSPRMRRARGPMVLLALALASPRADAEARVAALPAELNEGWEIAAGDPPGGLGAVARMTFAPVRVPGSWQEQGFDGHGVFWYRLRFDIDPTLWSVPLAITCEQVRDVDEVYLDGVLVGRTGRFPPAYDKATLMSRVYSLPPDVTARPGRHELLVRVYNAGPRAGGITGRMSITSTHDAFVGRARRELPRLLLAAAIGSLGLFSLFVFLRDRSQTGFLTFFVFTSGFALYVGTWTSAWVESRLPLSFLFRLHFALAFGLFSLFLLFFLRFFDRPPRLLHKAIVGLQAAGTLFCLAWPRVDDLYYAIPVAYLTIVVGSVDVFRTLVADTGHGLPYARPFLLGSSIVFACVLFDVAQDFGLLGDPVGRVRLAGAGVFVFSLVVLSLAADRIAKLRAAARSDALTGLANRAVLYERLALELARARRAGEALAGAVLDLDHFKRFNDRHGHLAGDKLLIAAAAAMRETTRDTDLVARYGGEEFVILLPATEREEALACLERVRIAVSAVRVPGVPEGTTVSIGVALYLPLSTPVSFSTSAFLRQADTALYRAKEQGRDRIVVAEGAPVRGSGSAVFSQEIIRPKFGPGGLSK